MIWDWDVGVGRGSMVSPTTVPIGRPCHMMHSHALSGPLPPSPRAAVALGRAGHPLVTPGRSHRCRGLGHPVPPPPSGRRARVHGQCRASPKHPTGVAVPLRATLPRRGRCATPPSCQRAAGGPLVPVGFSLARAATGGAPIWDRPPRSRHSHPHPTPPHPTPYPAPPHTIPHPTGAARGPHPPAHG